MKVLVSAYACTPLRGSEPGAGWAWARAAAVDHEVWLLTQAGNADIIAALEREPALRLTIVPVEPPRWLTSWIPYRGGIHFRYLAWQAMALRTARRLNREQHFDVAHHVTFAVDWMPAGVAYLRDVPCVWGPVGGATGMAWRLWRWLGARGIFEETAREAVTRFARVTFARGTIKRAAVIVGQNGDVARQFAKRPGVLVEPNLAFSGPALPAPAPDESEPRQRVALFVGQLTPQKGVRIAISALAQPAARNWRLEVFGDGAERVAAERLAAELHVADRIVWRGWSPREEVLEALTTADAMLFPSMHEQAGWSVGEAVAIGCPVVAFDRGGPAAILTPEQGVLVPASGDVAARLAEALQRVHRGFEPTHRWDADRLPALLAEWYQLATAPR